MLRAFVILGYHRFREGNMAAARNGIAKNIVIDVVGYLFVFTLMIPVIPFLALALYRSHH